MIKFPIKSQIFNLLAALSFVGAVYYGTHGGVNINHLLVLICAVLVVPYLLSAISAVLIKGFSAQKFLALFMRSLLFLNSLAGVAIIAFGVLGLVIESDKSASVPMQADQRQIKFQRRFQDDTFKVETNNAKWFCEKEKGTKGIRLYTIYIKKAHEKRKHTSGVMIENCGVRGLNLVEDDISLAIEKLSAKNVWQIFVDISPLLRPQNHFTTITTNQSLTIIGFKDEGADNLSTYRFALIKNKTRKYYSETFVANIRLH